jgi:two-component system, response regulator PdtaR
MCHVLIIEDDPRISRMIWEVLADSGAATFDTAPSKDTAVALAVARRPDFITSDVDLAMGTGPAAVLAIWEVHGRIPALFITATPQACAAWVPADDIVTKPFRPHAVSSRFRAMMV